MSTAAIFDAFAQMQPSQQIQLVEDLWDRIAESAEAPPLTQNQQEELRRRKVAAGNVLEAGRSWEEVRKGLLESDAR